MSSKGAVTVVANSAVVPTIAFQFDGRAVPEPELLLGQLGG